MADNDHPVYCPRCASIAQAGDRFCGVCGSQIPQEARDASPPEEVPTLVRPPSQARAGSGGRFSDAGASSRRRFAIPALLIGVGFLVVLAAGIGVSATFGPGSERVEVVPGVYSRIPEGWVLRGSPFTEKTGPDNDGEYDVEIVPRRYRNSTDSTEVSNEAASIVVSTRSCGVPMTDEVNVIPLSDFVQGGYSDHVSAKGTMTSGEGAVDGHKATWNLTYWFNAMPWTPPDASDVSPERLTASEYPNYFGSVSLEVCVAEDYSILYSVGGEMSTDDPPTVERNASVAEARDEVHEDIDLRYEANIDALKQIVEDLETDDGGGTTDIKGIPTSNERYDNALADPFDGRLEDTSVSGQGEYTSPESAPPQEVTMLPEPTTSDPETTDFGLSPGGEDEVRNAVEQYYYGVDYEVWETTYYNLDAESKALFTEEEWAQKNQWYADNEGLELDSMRVEVDMNGEEEAEVTVHRTFTDGTSITRDTVFVWEGYWRHHLTEEEKAIFMPGVPYEEFVEAQG